MALRPPDPNDITPRYTTVALVKERLQIPTADTSRDAEITTSIVSAEFAIDVYCGRGFPDLDEVEDPAVITIVPLSVETAALGLSIAFWKEADSSMGTAGSDDFWGSLSVQDTTRRILTSTPGLVGLRKGWGVG